jgi:hypothetical protein
MVVVLSWGSADAGGVNDEAVWGTEPPVAANGLYKTQHAARSTQQYSDTMNEGGAVRGQAQCQRMSSKITDGGSSQRWVHA